ncbi:hypothetical protein NP233_g5020 [Leucocoprinus birnbaumii]|uniref:H-type lectin domain-containing protein n=1 Tax=Leucocoprinus birnbaumii TaxID=56174 RepID=A0AAD5VXB5_9AGAR|nr:hypothetical protein NP233_g5020 [Leucocoprinus birnbaumii]
MSSITSFDSQSVRAWTDPQDDTSARIPFPSAFVLPPRLPLGIRQLDIDNDANIRARTMANNITSQSADYHVMTWGGTKLYSGIVNSLNLAPYNLEFSSGEVTRDLKGADDPTSVRVDFERPFISPPTVIVFFSHIDLDQNYNWRLKTSATHIDQEGFTLNIETWWDTILYEAKVSWIAYPSDRPEVWSTSVNTMEVRPYDRPQTTASKAVTFPTSAGFYKKPRIFVGFNWFDINCKHNFRLRAYVDNVHVGGLTWHIDTWSDSIVYSAGASIIAIR